MTERQPLQPMTELDEWKQAASVEAGLRREFYDRALTAEASLQEAYADHRKQKAEIASLTARCEAAEKALKVARAYLIEEAESGSIWSSSGNYRAVSAIDAVLGMPGLARQPSMTK
jgi:hypothetical protein